jgi:sulfite oxidase
VAHSYITPNELFFVRNHSPVPVLNEDNYKLVIKGREGQV